MSERHDIILRQHDGPNPPDLLQQLIEDVKKLVPESTKSAHKWLRAKGDKEVAKVQEIKASVYEKITKLEEDRKRQIQLRDEALRAAELEEKREEHEHKRAMLEFEHKQRILRIEALREAVECIRKLRKCGIEIDVKLIKETQKALKSLLKDSRS